MNQNMITQNELKEILDYNPETGVFTNKINRKKSKMGKIVGIYDKDKYLRITLNCKNYIAHRLAWLYNYGEWPKGQIDHINGVKDDNRIENLRVVNSRQNHHNLQEHRNGKLVGCSYRKNIKKWRAKIKINYKSICLGHFDTEEQAHEAYLKKLKEFDNE